MIKINHLNDFNYKNSRPKVIGLSRCSDCVIGEPRTY